MSSSGRRYAVLLRGLNVGSANRVAMADLRESTARAGGTAVRTVLASGNVAATFDAAPEAVRDALADAYRSDLGFTGAIHVVPVERLRAVVDGYPFDTLDGHHDNVVLCDDPELAGPLAARMSASLAADPTAPETETVAPGDACVYWRTPRGRSLRTPVADEPAARAVRTHVTTRTRSTLAKIVAAT